MLSPYVTERKIEVTLVSFDASSKLRALLHSKPSSTCLQ